VKLSVEAKELEPGSGHGNLNTRLVFVSTGKRKLLWVDQSLRIVYRDWTSYRPFARHPGSLSRYRVARLVHAREVVAGPLYRVTQKMHR
jgi:hypothetical protein